MIISISQYDGYILADSPSFYRTWVLGSQAGSQAFTSSTHYLNSTSYTSDGRTLSATIWPSSPLYENQPYHGLRYGIRILLENDTYSTYDIYIQQQRNGGWTTNTVEYAPLAFHYAAQYETSKPLEMNRTYTGLSNHGSTYINLSLDLDIIGYPDKYTIYSYVASDNGTILDKTYPVFIPSTPITRCGFYCIIPSVTTHVVPGQTSNMSIPIYSNDFVRHIRQFYGVRYSVYLVPQHDADGIKLSFSPKSIVLPLNGYTASQVQISVPDNIRNNNYTLNYIEKFIPLTRSFSSYGTKSLFTRNITVANSFNIDVKPFNIDYYEETVQYFATNPVILAIIYLVGTTLGIASPLLFYVWKKGRHHIVMDLKKKDILQINATVMVGVLVLLTLGTALLKHLNSGVISLITASVIFPFALSSIILIISKAPEKDHKVKTSPISYSEISLKLFPIGIMAMIVGFVYIIAAVITITFLG